MFDKNFSMIVKKYFLMWMLNYAYFQRNVFLGLHVPIYARAPSPVSGRHKTCKISNDKKNQRLGITT